MFKIAPLTGNADDFEVETTQLSFFADVAPGINEIELRLNVAGRNHATGKHDPQCETAGPLFEVRCVQLSVTDVQQDWKQAIETASFTISSLGSSTSAHLSHNREFFELAPGEVQIKYMGKGAFSLAVEGTLHLHGARGMTEEFGHLKLVCLLPFEGVWIERNEADSADVVELFFERVFNVRDYDVDRDAFTDAFVIRAKFVGS